MTTGYYVRVKRDGKWQSIDLVELSEAEINQVMAGRTEQDLINWIVALCQWIRMGMWVTQGYHK